MPSEQLSLGVALLALGATAYSAYTSHESLVLSRSSRQISLFDEFQGEYATVAAQFPPQMLDPAYRPARGTDGYLRLQAYWIFAYAEWFATNRLSDSGSLYRRYYAPLMRNALDVPSLAYVLQDMRGSYGAHRPEMEAFYAAMAALRDE